MAIADITAQRLRELLHYNPETGVFTWLVLPKKAWVKPGSIAGGIGGFGYTTIKINGTGYRASRLAWLYMTGEWPEHHIDHVDRDRSNNRWSNLRSATVKQNHENRNVYAKSESGHSGVTLDRTRTPVRWLARIKHNGVHMHIGRFERLEDAIAARVAAERRLFTHSPACAPQA